jgi:hypothetical protein
MRNTDLESTDADASVRQDPHQASTARMAYSHVTVMGLDRAGPQWSRTGQKQPWTRRMHDLEGLWGMDKGSASPIDADGGVDRRS